MGLVNCPTCHGSGSSGGLTISGACDTCDGQGRVDFWKPVDRAAYRGLRSAARYEGATATEAAHETAEEVVMEVFRYLGAAGFGSAAEALREAMR